MRETFELCGILTCVDSGELLRPLFKLETPGGVQSVAQQSWNTQAIIKGSDQTARMRRLILGFAGLTYHIVGSLMRWLIF